MKQKIIFTSFNFLDEYNFEEFVNFFNNSEMIPINGIINAIKKFDNNQLDQINKELYNKVFLKKIEIEKISQEEMLKRLIASSLFLKEKNNINYNKFKDFYSSYLSRSFEYLSFYLFFKNKINNILFLFNKFYNKLDDFVEEYKKENSYHNNIQFEEKMLPHFFCFKLYEFLFDTCIEYDINNLIPLTINETINKIIYYLIERNINAKII